MRRPPPTQPESFVMRFRHTIILIVAIGAIITFAVGQWHIQQRQCNAMGGHLAQSGYSRFCLSPDGRILKVMGTR